MPNKISLQNNDAFIQNLKGKSSAEKADAVAKEAAKVKGYNKFRIGDQNFYGSNKWKFGWNKNTAKSGKTDQGLRSFGKKLFENDTKAQKIWNKACDIHSKKKHTISGDDYNDLVKTFRNNLKNTAPVGDIIDSSKSASGESGKLRAFEQQLDHLPNGKFLKYDSKLDNFGASSSAPTSGQELEIKTRLVELGAAMFDDSGLRSDWMKQCAPTDATTGPQTVGDLKKIVHGLYEKAEQADIQRAIDDSKQLENVKQPKTTPDGGGPSEILKKQEAYQTNALLAITFFIDNERKDSVESDLKEEVGSEFEFNEDSLAFDDGDAKLDVPPPNEAYNHTPQGDESK